MLDYNRIYVGFDENYKGKVCRVLNTWRGVKTKHNVAIEFEDGYTMSCPVRCIRKVKNCSLLDIYGIDPDFTDGLSVEEFLKKQRGE